MKYLFFIIPVFVFSCTGNKPESQVAADSQNTSSVAGEQQINSAGQAEENSMDANSKYVNVFKDISLEDGIWFSENFDQTLDQTKNIDSAIKLDALPFVYFSFGGDSWFMYSFDFTEHMVGWEPREEIVIDSILYGATKKDYVIYVTPEKPQKASVDKLEVIYKDDYDEDKDGEADDKNTIEVKRFYKDKLISTKKYYRTHRSPSDIANYALLWGKYKDKNGDVFEFSYGESKKLEKQNVLTKSFLSIPDLYQIKVYSIKSPSLNTNYVLLPDEGGNDYVIRTENDAYGYTRTTDSLILLHSKGYIRLKKIE